MTALIISFWLPGDPEPQGSKRAFYNPKLKRAMVVDVKHASLRSWRQDIIQSARDSYHGEPLDVALNVQLVFAFSRPQGHFNSKGQLKASAPKHMKTGKDLDKLERAVLDALKIAGTIRDDSRVGRLDAVKDYLDCVGAQTSGLRVQISERDLP